MSAPATVQRMAPASGYPQQAAAQQVTPEKLKQLSQAVVNEYAKAVVQGIQTMFKNEDVTCTSEGEAKDIAVASFTHQGKAYMTRFKSERLHAGFSDKGIDAKIAKLDPANGLIFNALSKRSEELLEQPYAGFVRFVQADATNTLSQSVLLQGSVMQSQIFKSQVYICASRIPQNHKIAILALAAK